MSLRDDVNLIIEVTENGFNLLTIIDLDFTSQNGTNSRSQCSEYSRCWNHVFHDILFTENGFVVAVLWDRTTGGFPEPYCQIRVAEGLFKEACDSNIGIWSFNSNGTLKEFVSQVSSGFTKLHLHQADSNKMYFSEVGIHANSIEVIDIESRRVTNVSLLVGTKSIAIDSGRIFSLGFCFFINLRANYQCMTQLAVK